MKPFPPPISACRYCQFYKPLGRRGGSCEMLGVSVQGGWKGCHLGVLQFAANKSESAFYQPKYHIINEESEQQLQTVSNIETKNSTVAELNHWQV